MSIFILILAMSAVFPMLMFFGIFDIIQLALDAWRIVTDES